MDLTSPKTMNYLKKKYGFFLKKGLGQNFLCDSHVLDRIVEATQIDADTGVLEIGPGIGVLTAALAEPAKKVVAVETDARLLEVLSETLSGFNNISIIHADILKLDLPDLIADSFSDCAAVSIAANLPYYITTPILTRLLEERLSGVKNIVVMVQKEVGIRLCSAPGSKNYSPLSVLAAYHSVPEMICTVAPGSFVPPPKVDSAVIRLGMRSYPAVLPKDEKLFFRTVRAAFGQRRKTLINALAGSGAFDLSKDDFRETLTLLGLNENVRAEQLTLEDFCALSDAIWQKIK